MHQHIPTKTYDFFPKGKPGHRGVRKSKSTQLGEIPCKGRHADTITSECVGNRNCEQDEVPKVWSVVPHSKKVSRSTDTHRSKESCHLLRHSGRLSDNGSMHWKDFVNVFRIECPNTVQNKSPYEFLPMLTDICDKDRYEMSCHTVQSLKGNRCTPKRMEPLA